MASVIDVRNLSKDEQYKLVLDVLTYKKELKSEFSKIVPLEDDELSMEYIEKLIEQDFDRYDEVFRRLA